MTPVRGSALAPTAEDLGARQGDLLEMTDPTAADLLDLVWRDHGTPGSWIFTTKGLKYGDLYMAMTLMEQFRRRIAVDAPIKMLAISEGHMAVLRLFSKAFNSAHLVPELAPVTQHDFQLWCQARGVDHFGPGNMLYLHPSYYTHGPFNLMVAPTNPPLTFIDLCKIGLRLPSEVALGRPCFAEPARRAAALLAGASGLMTGRSIVLFPYAQSMPQEADAHFAALAARAMQEGFVVVTSVAGGEAPIAGTVPVRIPFDLLPTFCELAGHAVVVRSGIADILAAVDCRKVIIYATQPGLNNYSIIDMGTTQSAEEIVFRCADAPPEAFVELVLPLLLAPRPMTAQLRDIPSFVRQYFQQIDSWDGKAALGGEQPFPVRHLRGLRGLVLGEGWADLNSWGIWSLGERASIFLKNPFPNGPPRRPGESGLVEIEITARGAVSPALRRLDVQFRLGGATTQTVFQMNAGTRRPVIRIPEELAPEQAWRLDVRINGAKSPHDQSGGESSDHRTLGVGIEAVSIRPHRPLIARVASPA